MLRDSQACAAADDPLRRAQRVASPQSDAAPATVPADDWLADLDTPEGCARALLAALGAEGEAARKKAAELGSRRDVTRARVAFASLPSLQLTGQLTHAVTAPPAASRAW